MMRRFHRERGQDLVEYALVLPILLVLLFGIVEFGLIIFSFNTISDAAEVAARYGVIKPTDCSGIQLTVKRVTDAARLNWSNMTVPCPTLSGGAIRVQVSYKYNSYTHLFDAFIGRPYVLTATATMKTE
jgi:Flp pilus assembly protein TadG